MSAQHELLQEYLQGQNILVKEILTSATKHKYLQWCIMWLLKYHKGYSIRAIAELFEVSHGYCFTAIESIDIETQSVSPLRVRELKQVPLKPLSNIQIQKMFNYLGIG